MHRLIATAALGFGLFACAETEPTMVLVPAPSGHVVRAGPSTPAGIEGGGVLVTASRKVDRPTEVLGIVDAHEPSGNEAAALASLRARAASMGADAVLGVEFHHGDENHEPIHLSGLAVRYLESSP